MNAWVLLLLTLAVLAALWAYRAQYWRRRQNETLEDALKLLLEAETEGHPSTPEFLAKRLHLNPRRARRLVADLVEQELARTENGSLILTPSGRKIAEHILRAHRLLERYFVDEAHLPPQEVHALAHRLEHSTRPEDLRRLEAHLGFPAVDPHGDPIPHAGEGWAPAGKPLAEADAGEEGVVAHLEDEPQKAYERLLKEGLRVGQRVRVLGKDHGAVRISAEGRELVLSPELAANVTLTSGKATEIPAGAVPLSELPDGVSAEVVDIAPWVQGFTRRRLMDLGITPGALITPELRPFFRDPRAYRIRGTLIALREDQAHNIWVKPIHER